MTTQSIPVEARRSKVWFEDLPDKLESALASYDFDQSKDFEPLANLSEATLLEGVDVDPRTVIIAGSKLSAAATVYVKLQYDQNSKDAVYQNDGYPATVKFHLDGKTVIIDSIEPDVSSFYE
jgi:hypothetical protein